MTARQWLTLLLLSLLWGGSFFFIEVALTALPPLLLVLLRVAPAALALLAWALWRRLALPRGWRPWAALCVMGLLNNSLPFLLIAEGQLTVTGGLAAILNASTAFLAVLVGALCVPGERLTVARLAGVSLGVLGVAVTMGPAAWQGLSLAATGQVLVLLAALSYACAGAWGRLQLGDLAPPVSALGMLLMATLQLGVVVAVLVPDAAGSVGRALLDPAVAASMAALSLGGTALAYLLYFSLLRSAGPGYLLLVTVIVPVFAVGLDAAALGQLVRPHEALGGLVVAVGLVVMDGRLVPRAAHSLQNALGSLRR